VPPWRAWPGIGGGSPNPAASAVVATEAATNVDRRSAEASFLFLNMVDLPFCDQQHCYFANLIAASDGRCRVVTS
jgi:hypothetical protein